MIGNYVKWNNKLARIEDEYLGIVLLKVKGELIQTNLSILSPVHLRVIK